MAIVMGPCLELIVTAIRSVSKELRTVCCMVDLMAMAVPAKCLSFLLLE